MCMRGFAQPFLATLHPAHLTAKNKRGKLVPLEGRCWPREPLHQGLDQLVAIRYVRTALEKDMRYILSTVLFAAGAFAVPPLIHQAGSRRSWSGSHCLCSQLDQPHDPSTEIRAPKSKPEKFSGLLKATTSVVVQTPTVVLLKLALPD